MYNVHTGHFHYSLPISSVHVHWISVRNSEINVTCIYKHINIYQQLMLVKKLIFCSTRIRFISVGTFLTVVFKPNTGVFIKNPGF